MPQNEFHRSRWQSIHHNYKIHMPQMIPIKALRVRCVCALVMREWKPLSVWLQLIECGEFGAPIFPSEPDRRHFSITPRYAACARSTTSLLRKRPSEHRWADLRVGFSLWSFSRLSTAQSCAAARTAVEESASSSVTTESRRHGYLEYLSLQLIVAQCSFSVRSFLAKV